MFSAELQQKISNIASENDLNEDVAFKLFDEVGYVILDLKSRFSFFDSLVEIGIDKSVAGTMAREIDLIIFSELDKIKNRVPEGKKDTGGVEPAPQPVQQSFLEPRSFSEAASDVGSKSKVEPVPRSESKVGKDFEQIILNQARAMQPARPAVPPSNLPVSEETKTIHDYKSGDDPYREPVE